MESKTSTFLGHTFLQSYLPALCAHVRRSEQPHCICYRPSSILVQRWDPALEPHFHTPHTAQCQKSWASADRRGGYIHCIPYLRKAKRDSQLLYVWLRATSMEKIVMFSFSYGPNLPVFRHWLLNLQMSCKRTGSLVTWCNERLKFACQEDSVNFPHMLSLAAQKIYTISRAYC